jgi:diguanylate cyclase (GGDEF)-like protein
VPGGLLLGLVTAFVYSPLLTRVAPSIGFYYFAVFTCGLLLAWRFNSSRVLFSLLLLLLAHRAVEFFGPHGTSAGTGRTAVIAVALLLPLNYIALAFMRERGLTVAGIVPRFGSLFLQSVVVAVLCRPENAGRAGASSGWRQFPLWAGLTFVAAVITFAVRYWQTRKPIETGFVWSLAAVFLWLYSMPIGKTADAYVATAGLLLVASIIETSYVLAYHDELTGIPGRRAFNEALLSLDQNYAIAIVDIDHFKKFNDTYGHDVGDQVLRMVASRLAEVGREGRAFRCGGEEFAIVFRNTAARDATEVLERLRLTIESSSFHLRASERRTAARAAEAERRKTTGRRSKKAPLIPATDDLSVTVSIGVAEPGTRYRQPEQVIQAADQALYRAKHNGRNRVELASIAPLRVTRGKRASASRS